MIEAVKVGGEILVNSLSSGGQTRPVITGLANGDFIVAWDDSGGIGVTDTRQGAFTVQAQLFDASGAKKGDQFALSTGSQLGSAGISITDLANGGFVASWGDTHSNTGLEQIARVFDANGVGGSRFYLESTVFGDHYKTDLTNLANGGFVATWFCQPDQFNPAVVLSAQIFDANGAKQGGEFNINTTAANENAEPKVTGLANGGFVITWFNPGALGGDYNIRAQVFDAAGVQQGAEFRVTPPDEHHAIFPAITALANGGFVVAWRGVTGDFNEKAQIFDATGTKVGDYIDVLCEPGNKFKPAITGLANGGFVVTWSDFDSTLGDNSDLGIKAQVFDANGVKQGGEFLVNTETYDRQDKPRITALKDGGFVVTWENSGAVDISTDYSIRAQVFRLDTKPEIDSNGGAATAAVSVAENGTAVTTVHAADPDAGTKLAYSITGGTDAALFQIDATTGALSFKAAPNFEGPGDAGGDNVYDVVVQASDGSLTAAQAIAVTVTNVNEAPVIGSNGGGAAAGVSVAENSTAVTTVTAADPDAGTTLVYSISGGADAAKFQIDAATGALSFKAAPNFEAPGDAGANNVYDVIVQASDGSLTDTQAIAVTVTNVAEAPVISSNAGGATAAILVAENTAAVTTVVAADPEAGTKLAYSISGGADAALFQIDAVTGALSFKAAPNFEAPTDAGANNIYDVIVQASDGSLTDTQAIAVTVTNVNEAPLLNVISVAENTTAVTTIAAGDPDSEDAALVYSISGGADAAKFQIDAVTGELSFRAAPNYEARADAGANNVYDVIVQASDGALSDTQAIAVRVRNVNEAPVITSSGGGAAAAISVAENSADVTVVHAADPDAKAKLAYSISGGADAALFQIDATTGALSFKAAPNFEAPGDTGGNNVYDVIVQASDGSLTDTQGIAVTVTDVPYNPVGGTSAGETLTGTSADDRLLGLGGDDTLNGLAGEDLLDGGSGNDTMTGGSGNDIYVVDAVGDKVIELAGGGADTVRTALGVYTLGNNVEDLTFTNGAVHKGNGNALVNHLTGGAGADTLDGKGGADILEGGLGNDTYLIGEAGEVAIEQAGGGVDKIIASVSFVLSANVENLTLKNVAAAQSATGNDSDNVLTGNAFANAISGSGGNDRVLGGLGNDTLTGGSGADAFVFDTTPNTASNLDTVTDFVSGTDTLVFDKTVYTAFTAVGAIGADALYAGAGVNAAHDATDRIIYNTATGALWYDADGTGAGSAVEVAVLGGHPALAFSDILIAA